jgi:hypothetical protein
MSQYYVVGLAMKKFFLSLAATLSISCLLTACNPAKTEPPAGSESAPSTRNNCYSLLHQLLNEQKDVSLLHLIKKEHSDVKDLIKKIADASGAGSKLLEELAKHDPSINLDDIGLPPGEIAARAAIASAKKMELLGQTGDQLDLTLLLTQTEALSYASQLAKIAGQNDSRPDRARALEGLSTNLQSLYQDVFAMLLWKEK